MIYEPFYAPVEGIRAEIAGRRLRGRDIREEQAESRDLFLTGGRYHVLDVPETPSVGEQVHYEYRRTYSDVAYTPLVYIPSGDRLDRFTIAIDHPGNVDVEFHVAFPRDSVVYRVDQSSPGRSTLVFEGLDPLIDLPYFGFNGYHAVVQMAFRTADGAVNPVEAEDFGSWYQTLASRTVSQAQPEGLSVLAASLQRERPTETVAALHDYVRSTIRYVADERGENAFVPRAPDVVLERGYGDCKDRAFLVAALAEQLGITVDIVLVSTEPEPSFPGTHVGLYNHVINAFEEEEGRYTYFDPTHRYMPYQYLPESDAEGSALHITASSAALISVPAPQREPEIDAHIQASLEGEGTAKVTLRGNVLASVRYFQDQGGALDVENLLSTVLGDAFYKMRFTDFVVAKDEVEAITVRGAVDLSEFVIASPTRRYLPVTAFTTVPAEAVERADDAFALHLPGRPDYRLRLDLAAAGWAPDPADHRIGDPDGPVEFTSSLSPTEEGFRIDYRFIQRQKRLHGDARTAYLDAARSYLDARRDVFIVNPVPVAETPGR